MSTGAAQNIDSFSDWLKLELAAHLIEVGCSEGSQTYRSMNTSFKNINFRDVLHADIPIGSIQLF